MKEWGGAQEMVSPLFGRRKPARSFIILLVEGGPEFAGIHGVRMLPKREYGGALVGTGESVSVPWASIRQGGLSAFATLEAPRDSAENTDFHPRTGRFRSSSTVLVEVEGSCLVLSPSRRVRGRVSGARDEDRLRYALPISGSELEAAIRAAFASAGVAC